MAQAVKKPKVTVLMPVYNAEKYLHAAIESILKQTFTDFEFLIINDKSTDNSVAIIESFKDSRIRLLHNEKNLGPIDTPNKGMKLAQGEYIARMDNDDISLPDRLMKQVAFLDANPLYAVVATNIILMNADGEDTGYWQDDINTKTFEEIKSFLPKADCIAHPTVMLRKTVLDNYSYNNKQKGGDDWDLWMRMVADGVKIGKINEVLVRYRILSTSVSRSNQTGKTSQQKVIRIKKNFLLPQIAHFKINNFFFRVLYSWFRSVARYCKLYIIPDTLRGIKRIITANPFKVYSDFRKLKKYLSNHNHSLVFFFPYTVIGGAERVHFEIVKCFKDKNPLVFFTGFSENSAFLKYFEENAKVFNIPHTLNYPVVGRKSRRLVADYINKQAKPVTLGSNSAFYFDLLSNLSPSVFCVDIKHTYILPTDAEEIQLLPRIIRLDKRIFIGEKSMENMLILYHNNNIPRKIAERLIHIRNFTSIPGSYFSKHTDGILNILYVGRVSPEKRIDIIFKVAEECSRQKLPVQFQFVGNTNKLENSNNYSFIEFKGEIRQKDELEAIYKQANIMLITSAHEGGLPLSGMEAMANGVIPISTLVGDVPIHIKNGENGFITSSNESDEVVKEMVAYIKTLLSDRALVSTMSLAAYQYAKTNFSSEKFENAYRTLLGF